MMWQEKVEGLNVDYGRWNGSDVGTERVGCSAFILRMVAQHRNRHRLPVPRSQTSRSSASSTCLSVEVAGSVSRSMPQFELLLVASFRSQYQCPKST